MEGLTLDTGALVGIERADADVFAILEIAFRRRVRVTVPTVVVAEWWRGGRGRSLRMLDPFVLAPSISSRRVWPAKRSPPLERARASSTPS